MNYLDWILRVTKNVQAICGCDYGEADRRVGEAMHLDGRLCCDAWAHRWYRAGIDPKRGAENVCALSWGWEPRNTDEHPFPEIPLAQVKIRASQTSGAA